MTTAARTVAPTLGEAVTGASGPSPSLLAAVVLKDHSPEVQMVADQVSRARLKAGASDDDVRQVLAEICRRRDLDLEKVVAAEQNLARIRGRFERDRVAAQALGIRLPDPPVVSSLPVRPTTPRTSRPTRAGRSRVRSRAAGGARRSSSRGDSGDKGGGEPGEADPPPCSPWSHEGEGLHGGRPERGDRLIGAGLVGAGGRA